MLYWEDFHEGHVATCGRYVVGREEIIAFAREYDPSPIHLDDAAAEATRLGGLSASGWHLCCIFMRLTADGMLNNSDCLGSPGIDEVRFLKPVHPGTVLSLRREVLETRSSKSKPEMGLGEVPLRADRRRRQRHGRPRRHGDVRPAQSRLPADLRAHHAVLRRHRDRREDAPRDLHLHGRRDRRLRPRLGPAALPSRRRGRRAHAFRRPRRLGLADRRHLLEAARRGLRAAARDAQARGPQGAAHRPLARLQGFALAAVRSAPATP